MELEQHRQMLIQHNHLHNTDGVYTFYYDESNNIRRLYLTESGLNVQPGNFVLAGIAREGLDCKLILVLVPDQVRNSLKGRGGNA